MKHKMLITLGLILLVAAPLMAEVQLDGFVQGLYGGRLDENNPTATEYTAAESRMQLRAQHWGDQGQFFGRLDFVWDGAEPETTYDWELREAYFKFRMGSKFNFKIGRQVLTWGTGDLIFINDVFAKDYRSFFIGRDDQYLKSPQNALRAEYYSPVGSVTLVWSPRFEPDILPNGTRLSLFNPMDTTAPGGAIVGGTGFPDVPLPESKFENSEIAARFIRQISVFRTALYFYKGFYKDPVGFKPGPAPGSGMSYYPKLNVYGASVRGQIIGGILWVEGGYFDSREDLHGTNLFIPNSSAMGLLGFERQIANNLTASIQWQADYMFEHDRYKLQQQYAGMYVRDELYHLLTTRWTKLLNSELVKLSLFAFYSPTDEDAYIRLSVSYKYTDEIELTVGGNIFDGNYEATDFGQFQKDDNAYVKMTYGF